MFMFIFINGFISLSYFFIFFIFKTDLILTYRAKITKINKENYKMIKLIAGSFKLLKFHHHYSCLKVREV